LRILILIVLYTLSRNIFYVPLILAYQSKYKQKVNIFILREIFKT